MYIDVILLENIFVNYLILYITAILAKYRSTSVRLFLGSLTGSLYIIPMFIYRSPVFQTVSLKLILSALIVIIVFYPSRLKDFVRLTSFFYLVTMIFGGTAFSLYYLYGNIDGYFSDGIFVFSDFPFILIIITMFIGVFLIYYCIEYVKKLHKNIMQIEVMIGDSTLTTYALVDTGNTLYEPISHLPVIIIEFGVLEKILPESVNEYLLNLRRNNLIDFGGITEFDPQWLKRFRLLPFKDIGKENGILLGIKPDGLRIYCEDKVIVINDAILGVYFDKLSNDDEFYALLHADLLTD